MEVRLYHTTFVALALRHLLAATLLACSVLPPTLSIVVEPYLYRSWLLIAQSLRLSHYGTQGSKGFPAIHEVFNPLAICLFVVIFAISNLYASYRF